MREPRIETFLGTRLADQQSRGGESHNRTDCDAHRAELFGGTAPLLVNHVDLGLDLTEVEQTWRVVADAQRQQP